MHCNYDYYKLGHALKDSLKLLTTCVCPGYTKAFFECTVAGTTSGSTVWEGSAFHCANNGDEINILHKTGFMSREMKCNDGIIVGRGLRVQDNCFTSQLIINITSDMIGESIECIYDDALGNETIIGSLTIAITGPGKIKSHLASSPDPLPSVITIIIAYDNFICRSLGVP